MFIIGEIKNNCWDPPVMVIPLIITSLVTYTLNLGTLNRGTKHQKLG